MRENVNALNSAKSVRGLRNYYLTSFNDLSKEDARSVMNYSLKN